MKWSSTFNVAPTSKVTEALPGDKILLPQSALEQLLQAAPRVSTSDTSSNPAFDPFDPYSVAAARQYAAYGRSEQPELPHPLTFRLVNQATGNVVYAGIREFSAEEGEIGLSPFLREALGVKATTQRPKEELENDVDNPIDLDDIEDEEPVKITVHFKRLSKGTYVRLRPLEAGYNPDDWRALLERHMRENYTTLTNNEVLKIPDRSKKGHDFRFLIDKFAPGGDGICVVDTDLEVDIEALNEEQARETLKQIMSKKESTAEGSSAGGILDAWTPVDGHVQPGDYVDYELTGWDRTQGIEVEVTMDEEDDIDLFASPLSSRHRARPRQEEHVFGNFECGVPSKRFRIQSSNIELEGAESLYISVHSPQSESAIRPSQYTLRARIVPNSECNEESTDMTESEPAPNADEEQCKNCQQSIPKRTMMLHENFCFRNNIVCQDCGSVFRKNSPEWNAHWHCDHDLAHGNNPASQTKHNYVYHKEHQCPSCDFTAGSLPDLAQHRTTVCPGKLILCRFCHLSVPQEGDPANPSAEELLSGLTAHELADGSRTEHCYLCQKIVRLRDMDTHLKHHELNKSSKPLPRICRNINCGRTLNGVGKNGQIGTGQQTGNDLGLCSICFGPLYVSLYDPEGKAMKRRIERRYLTQMLSGCGKSWCGNECCKSGKVNLGLAEPGVSISAKDALPLIQPLLQNLMDSSMPMYFCVDEASQKRRKLAEMMASEGIYELEWCIAALEGENGDLDTARQWLQNWAPKKSGSPK